MTIKASGGRLLRPPRSIWMPVCRSSVGDKGQNMSLLLLLNQPATNPADVGVTTTSTVTLEKSVQRAPFSEYGIADRVQEDPEAYRSLAAFVASTLQRDIDRLDAITAGSDSNSVAVVKGELKRLQEGFQEVSTAISQEGVLTREAAEKVGHIISGLRTGFAAWYEGNKEIAEGAQKLASVVLAALALHIFGGVSADIAAIISVAVVNQERVADILHGHKKEKE
jgi:hypothetical protein